MTLPMPTEAPTILIVEDDEDARDLLKRILDAKGFNAAVAGDGAEALQYLRASEDEVDLILLDLMMPKMNGWEFRAAQLEDERFRSIPVVVLTADARAAAKAEEVSASGYVAKPVAFPKLMEMIERVCR
jgi:two-component system, chemotaxis family, chemotaxis protein CheY